MFWWDSNFEREMAWEVTEAISGKQTGNLDQSPSKLVPTHVQYQTTNMEAKKDLIESLALPSSASYRLSTHRNESLLGTELLLAHSEGEGP